MPQSTPRVSVVIPAHNNARYLPCAIDSILAQHFQDWELIVVDDASTDQTAEVLAAYREPRLRVITNQTRQGIAGTRNRGIEAARGEYTAALDSDDWAHPERLLRQVAFLDAHTDHAAVGSWARWMYEDGRPQAKITTRPTLAEDAAAQLIFKSCLQQPSVTGRTAVLRSNPYDENYDLSSDYELWARLAQRYKLTSQPLTLVTCRSHSTSTTWGRSERVAARQKAIFSMQLDRMGISYRPEDLERHRLIWRSNKQDRPLSLADLDGVEEWLHRLAAANAQSNVYDVQSFAAVLGWGWLQACRSTLRQTPMRALLRGIRSPLRRLAAAGARDQIARQFRAYVLARRRTIRAPAFSVPSPQAGF